MATKNPVSNKSVKKAPKSSRKKLILAAIILLCILSLGALGLRKDTYTATKGPSTHSTPKAIATTQDVTTTQSSSSNTPAASTSAKASSSKPATSAASTPSATASGSSTPSNPSPTPAATPTPDPFSIEPPYGQVSPSYACGAGSHQFTFTGSVTANGAGTISYRWAFSDGATTPGQFTFTGAGTQQFQTTWTLGQQDYTGWARLEVTSPFETASKASDASFTLESTCAP